MTTSFAQANNQDSSSYRGFVVQDTLRVSIDSVNAQVPADSVVVADTISVILNETEAPVYRRITTASTTSISSNSIIPELYADTINNLPIQFVYKNNEMLSEKHLRSGEELPINPFRNDWIISVIIISIILFSTAYASSKTIFSGVVRFFLFIGTKESENKTAEMFRWKSMFFNVSSFCLISLFVYFSVSYNNVIPAGLSGFKIWLFSAAIIVIALILRHLVCATIGLMSGTLKIFNDYIITVYQSYRFAGFFLLIVIVLFFYTPLITAKSCLITGCVVVVIIYLMRIFRLFLLFINYKISIFYLILYLCALEILPVLVSIKYFSGLM